MYAASLHAALHCTCIWFLHTTHVALQHTEDACIHTNTHDVTFTSQPFLDQAFTPHPVFLKMECNQCKLISEHNFRARAPGKVWFWWCNDCYALKFQEPHHEIEHPIPCAHCRKAPASMRACGSHPNNLGHVTTVYWCFHCYETYDHQDLPHQTFDLDSDSDDEDSAQDDEVAPQVGHQDDLQSMGSWCYADDTMSLKSWNKLDDDAKSNDSFMMSWAQLDDDAQSNSSFQMVALEQQEQEEQQPPIAEELELEEETQQQQQQHQQKPGRMVEILALDEPAPAPGFGSWVEDDELQIALAISKAEAEDSSSSSSSSSSRTCMAASAAHTLQRKEISKTAKKIPKTKLQPIQENCEIFPLQYQSSSGCIELSFLHEFSEDAAPICPVHSWLFHPHCAACANVQFLRQKYQHELQEHQAIEASLDTSYITHKDGKPSCSNHQIPQESCNTCQQVVELLDQLAD